MNLKLFSRLLFGFVGLFFAVAASVKLADPEAFLSSLLTYQLFPHRVAVLLVVFAPVLELVLAACLILGLWKRGAASLTIASLLVFDVLIAQGLVRGLSLDCGCFGSNELKSTADYLFKMGQNLLLAFAVCLAWFFDRPARTAS